MSILLRLYGDSTMMMACTKLEILAKNSHATGHRETNFEYPTPTPASTPRATLLAGTIIEDQTRHHTSANFGKHRSWDTCPPSKTAPQRLPHRRKRLQTIPDNKSISKAKDVSFLSQTGCKTQPTRITLGTWKARRFIRR
jgi:hypothetical protein